MRDLPFVDAHMHLWDLGRLRYPWLMPPFSDEGPNGSVEAIAHTYLPADYRRDTAGWNVVGAVHVEAGAHPEDSAAESDWLQSLSAAEGLPQALVVYADLRAGDLERRLERQASRALVRGVRHIANWHPDPAKTYGPTDPLADPAWRAGYAMLAKFGLSFDLQIYGNQLSAAAELAARHPEVPVILNHAGMPIDRDEDGVARWRRGMRALARLEHASVKISGLGLVDHGWTLESIRPFVLETVELFGPRRCMVASDAPTDKLFSPIGQVLDAYAEILDRFSKDEQREMFAGAAARTYRLPLEV